MVRRYDEERRRVVAAPPEVVWEVVSTIGGESGWYCAQWAWRVRARLDRMVGGPGMRGRSPGPPQVGDPVDFWRVTELQPGRRLRLRAEMRLPGTAELEFHVGDGKGLGDTHLTQRAAFVPRGPAGHAYWWAQWPAHRVVFAGMLNGIAEEGVRRFDATS